MAQLTPPGWSPDANWFWDGRAWQDAISPNGKSRYNGREWKRFRGKRTAMPLAPLYVAAPGVPPAPVAAIEMPSWVAPSEVERIVKEKQEAAAYAAAPVIPPPPELDWRQAGRFIKHSKDDEGEYKDWQVGGASIAYFIICYLLCNLAGLIFIWRTAWRLPTKVMVTIGAIVLPVAIYFISVGSGLLPGVDYRR